MNTLYELFKNTENPEYRALINKWLAITSVDQEGKITHSLEALKYFENNNLTEASHIYKNLCYIYVNQNKLEFSFDGGENWSEVYRIKATHYVQ